MSAEAYQSLVDAPPGLYRDPDGDTWARLGYSRGAVVLLCDQHAEHTERELRSADKFGPFVYFAPLVVRK